MNRLICISVILFLAISIGQAQEASNKEIRPILLDKSVLSGLGLQKIELKNEPEKDFFQKNLFRGKNISVYVVSSETWNNRMDQFPFDEFIYMFQGEALVKPDKGPSQLFYSGEYFFAPKGFTGEWEIRSGDHWHYELSIIATRRADTSRIVNGGQHLLFDRSTLSGADTQLGDSGRSIEVLKAGVELTVKLVKERPRNKDEFHSEYDQMMQLLSGQITLVSPSDSIHTFYTGDFFIIPAGFRGSWESKGHGLVKYLSVSESQ